MNPNRTAPAEARMEPKRVVVDLQQLDLLEQKIVKATELIRSLRRERDAAQAKVRDLEAQLHASEKGRQELRELTEQLDVLREERQAIRGRVNQMIEMMTGLEEGGGETRRDH